MTTYTIDRGTEVIAVNADGKRESKALTKPVYAPSDAVQADERGYFIFPLKPNSKGWVSFIVDPANVVDMLAEEREWDAAMQERERDEDARVAAYKARRDAPPVPDGTYTVVQPDGSYVTLRFETSKNAKKMDGSVNTWYGKQFVQYLNGPDNETDFQSFGTWEHGDVNVWRRYQGSMAMVKYIKAAHVVAETDDRGELGMAYAMRSGRCCQCGRKLTVPASLHRGMGPVCAEGGRDS